MGIFATLVHVPRVCTCCFPAPFWSSGRGRCPGVVFWPSHARTNEPFGVLPSYRPTKSLHMHQTYFGNLRALFFAMYVQFLTSSLTVFHAPSLPPHVQGLHPLRRMSLPYHGTQCFHCESGALVCRNDDRDWIGHKGPISREDRLIYVCQHYQDHSEACFVDMEDARSVESIWTGAQIAEV